MSKTRIIFIYGVWVAILPFLGFPSSLKSPLLVFTGLSLIYFSYTIQHKISKTKEEQKRTFDNFRENHDFFDSKTRATTEEPKEN